MQEMLYYFEFYGWYFVIITYICSLIASARVSSTFKKYSKQVAQRGFTGAEAAQRVLSANGITNVRIARTAGNLTDHYDPRDNTIYLSDSVHDSASTAAIGVAAHEAGHAVQHAQEYTPIRIRTAIVPLANFGSKLAMPLIVIGLFISASELFPFGYEVSMLGVLLFGLSVLFHLVTLPTEFNASRRAMEALEQGNILVDDELKGARKTLTAAAMTYVVSFAASLVQFLRLLSVVSGGRGRRR